MLDDKLTGYGLSIALLIWFHILVLVVTMIRYVLERRSKKLFHEYTTRSKSHFTSYVLSDKSKYASINFFKWSDTFFYAGMCFALFFVFLVFNYSVLDANEFEIGDVMWDDKYEMIEQKMHSLPPPPLPEIKEPEIKKEIVKIPKPLVFSIRPVEQVLQAKAFVSNPEPKLSLIKTPKTHLKKEKPAKKSKTLEEKTYVISEEMPLFPGTISHSDSQKALLKYIYKHLKYPILARENQIEGKVIIRFVVNKAGMIQDIKLLRDPGYKMGEAVIKLVSAMNLKEMQWTPGKQGGEKVKVAFTLPIKFSLQ